MVSFRIDSIMEWQQQLVDLIDVTDDTIVYLYITTESPHKALVIMERYSTIRLAKQQQQQQQQQKDPTARAWINHFSWNFPLLKGSCYGSFNMEGSIESVVTSSFEHKTRRYRPP